MSVAPKLAIRAALMSSAVADHLAGRPATTAQGAALELFVEAVTEYNLWVGREEADLATGHEEHYEGLLLAKWRLVCEWGGSDAADAVETLLGGIDRQVSKSQGFAQWRLWAWHLAIKRRVVYMAPEWCDEVFALASRTRTTLIQAVRGEAALQTADLFAL